MNVWFTSDLHLQHERVAELRGFDTVEEHDEAVLSNWADTVAGGDIVWVLGDLAIKHNPSEALGKIQKLPGEKHLIPGNHDKVWPGNRDSHKWLAKYMWVFESVQAFARRKTGARNYLLSHFPYAGGGDHTGEERYTQYRLRDEGLWLLHGHTHSESHHEPGTRQFHVGLDAWEMGPVALEDVSTIISNYEAMELDHGPV